MKAFVSTPSAKDRWLPGLASLDGKVNTGTRPITANGEQWPRTSTVFLVAMLVAHILGALVMKRLPIVATIHALGTLAISLFVVLRSHRATDAVCAVAYIAGAEVLWRMTNASLPWEYGKYTVVLIALAALARRGFKGLNYLPILYFLLLLPSCVLTFGAFPLDDARKQIGFNLSGPLSCAVCIALFASIRTQPVIAKRCLMFYLGPAAGIAGLALFGIHGAGEISFASGSNFAASGGFGPVQVSSALGLATVIAFHFANDSGLRRTARIVALSLTLWFLGQSVLTFSRTGLYSSGLSIAVAMPFLLCSNRFRWQALSVLVGLVAIAVYVIFPVLNNFTGGNLERRFSDSRTSGRDQLLQNDVDLWLKSPMLGVGPGVAKLRREKSGVAAHTEYSRLLSEHGILGLGAATVLFIVLVRQFPRRSGMGHQALVASLLLWALMFMASDAMRVVAVAFALSFGAIKLSALPGARSRRDRSIARSDWSSGISPPSSLEPRGI
jgi:hypothetical protein